MAMRVSVCVRVCLGMRVFLCVWVVVCVMWSDANK